MASAARAAGVVSLQATSATVQNPGDMAQICVVLSTGGNQVAGTGNDLVWDGTCATLADQSNCQSVGSHGKELSGALNPQGQDFSYRGLVLSLTNTKAIPDGPLYCCSFEGEAEPGGCCNITVINTSASDPKGGTVPAIGNTAQLCTATAANQPARGFGSTGGTGQPLSASNAPAGNDMGSGATTAPPPPAGAGAAAPPPVQVLQGGGARVENPAAGAPAGPPVGAPVQAVTPGAAQEPAAGVPPAAALPPAAGVPAAAVAPSTVAATSAPTQAPTKPPPADTPTVNAPSAAPTAATKAMPAKPQAAAAPADPPSGGGLFGCQIGGATSGAPLVGLIVLGLVGRTVRRRRGTRRPPSSRTQR